MLLIKHNEAWDPRTFLLIQGSHEVRRSCWLAVEKAGHRGVLGKGVEMERGVSTATHMLLYGKWEESKWPRTTHSSLSLTVPIQK